MKLIDLGKATKQTKGMYAQPFYEQSLPPFNSWRPL